MYRNDLQRFQTGLTTSPSVHGYGSAHRQNRTLSTQPRNFNIVNRKVIDMRSFPPLNNKESALTPNSDTPSDRPCVDEAILYFLGNQSKTVDTPTIRRHLKSCGYQFSKKNLNRLLYDMLKAGILCIDRVDNYAFWSIPEREPEPEPKLVTTLPKLATKSKHNYINIVNCELPIEKVPITANFDDTTIPLTKIDVYRELYTMYSEIVKGCDNLDDANASNFVADYGTSTHELRLHFRSKGYVWNETEHDIDGKRRDELYVFLYELSTAGMLLHCRPFGWILSP